MRKKSTVPRIVLVGLLLVSVAVSDRAAAYSGPVLAPLTYDFGPGPVHAGYTAVQKTTSYSSSTHFGWTGTLPNCDRDRGTPDPLRQDFVCDDTGALRTFAVDVPNGRYRVREFVGDAVSAQLPMDMLAEGVEKVHARATSGAGDYTVADFFATVADGQLSLGFRATTAGDTWRINSLDIMPDVLNASDEFTDAATLSTLAGVTKTLVFSSVHTSGYQYMHNAAVVEIGGVMIVGWYSAHYVEFDNESRAAFSYSTDSGATWSTPGIITDDPDGTGLQGRAFNGWWTRGSTVYAMVEQYTKGSTATGRTNQTEHLYQWDPTTKTFSDQGVMQSNFIPHGTTYQLTDGDYLVHGTDVDYNKVDLVGGSAALTSFTRVAEPTPGDDHLMGESSSYQRPTGAIYQYYRDRSVSNVLYRSRSFDNGLTWEAPTPTNYPDATAKQYVGRSGSSYFILSNSNGNTLRHRLTIATSTDGLTFSKPQIIDTVIGSVSYPHGGYINSHLYAVADVDMTAIYLYKLS